MEITHTAGPWHVWHCSPTHVVVQASDHRTVARLIHRNFEPNQIDLAETAANANLIANAPSLMQTLRSMHSTFKHHASASPAAQSAIAAAEQVMQRSTSTHA